MSCELIIFHYMKYEDCLFRQQGLVKGAVMSFLCISRIAQASLDEQHLLIYGLVVCFSFQ